MFLFFLFGYHGATFVKSALIYLNMSLPLSVVS